MRVPMSAERAADKETPALLRAIADLFSRNKLDIVTLPGGAQYRSNGIEIQWVL